MELTVRVSRNLDALPIVLQFSLRKRLPSQFQFFLSALLLFSAATVAAPPFSDVDMQNYLRQDRAGLARLNAPVFFFGQKNREPPCIPTWAYQGTQNSNDTYDEAHRTKPARRCFYEDVGCYCRRPGVDIVNRAPAFPVYFTIRECTPTEIRVVFNLFYEKDGAIVVVPFRQGYYFDVGHGFDWERVVVVYKKDSATMLWSADHLMMSQHGGYEVKVWSKIRQTLSTRQAALPDPRHIVALRGQNHPVVYVGWLKHPHFDSKDTFPWGWALQLTNKAFRSDDWWLLVDQSNLIEASDSTLPGRTMRMGMWGDADSIPPKVDQGVCSVHLRRGFVATSDSDLFGSANLRFNGTSIVLNGTTVSVGGS